MKVESFIIGLVIGSAAVLTMRHLNIFQVSTSLPIKQVWTGNRAP